MKVYILDDIFFESTTNYKGKEIIFYPVQLSIFEIKKLKKLGIQYTTDPKKAGAWIKHIECITQRDFGGIMIKESKDAIKLSIPWDDFKK